MMLNVKLNNGNTFEATSVSENYSIKSREGWQLAFSIEESDNDVEYYRELLQEEGALDVIDVINVNSTNSFVGYTEIRNVDRTITATAAKIRIVLVKPVEKVETEE